MNGKLPPAFPTKSFQSSPSIVLESRNFTLLYSRQYHTFPSQGKTLGMQGLRGYKIGIAVDGTCRNRNPDYTVVVEVA